MDSGRRLRDLNTGPVTAMLLHSNTAVKEIKGAACTDSGNDRFSRIKLIIHAESC